MEGPIAFRYALAIFIVSASCLLFGTGIQYAIEGKVIPSLVLVAPLLLLLAWGFTR